MRRLLLATALWLAGSTAAFAGPVASGWPAWRADSQRSSSSTVILDRPLRVKWDNQLPQNSFFSGVGEVGFGFGDFSVTSWNNERMRAGVSIGTGGRIFVPYGRVILAVHPSTGGVIWSSQEISPLANGSDDSWSQPVVISTVDAVNTPVELVITSSVNCVTAFHAATGLEAWKINPALSNISAALRSPPVAASNGVVFFGNSTEGQGFGGGSELYAVNSSTGGVLWRYTPPSAGTLGPAALSPDEATVYVNVITGSDLGVHALNALTGVFISSHTQGPQTSEQARAVTVDSDGGILMYRRPNNSTGNTLLKYNLLTGTTVWESVRSWAGTISPRGLRSGAVYNGSAIFVNSNNASAEVTAINRATGATLWNQAYSALTVQTGASRLNASDNGFYSGPMDNPPTLLGNTTMYILDGSGFLVNVNAANGSVRSRHKITNFNDNHYSMQTMAGGVSVSSDGLVYVLFLPTGGDRGKRRLIALEDSGAAFLSVSTAPAQVVGTVWYATVTTRVTDIGSSPVARAPVDIVDLVESPSSTFLYTPNIRKDSTVDTAPNDTNHLGVSTWVFHVDLNSLPLAQWATMNATATVHAVGFGPVEAPRLQETRASTFTVTVSAPSIEDNAGKIIRVTTLTFTATGPAGLASNLPVAVATGSYNADVGGACGQLATVSPANRFQLTDGSGNAVFTVRHVLSANGFECIPTADYSVFRGSVTAFALGLNPVSIDLTDHRASSFTVAVSTPVIQSDLRASTMTITVRDAFSAPVPNAVVALRAVAGSGTAGPVVPYFKTHSALAQGGPMTLVGYTDGAGQATFIMQAYESGAGAGTSFDSYNDFIATFPVAAIHVAMATTTMAVESNFLDNYQVEIPTVSAVGVSFTSTVTARNVHNHMLARYNEGQVALIPLFTGTAVQGTGTLGTAQITFAVTNGRVIISSQNYNRIEDIDVKAVRNTGNRTGLSNMLHITGPDRFTISIPTGAPAGGVFIATISAVDAGGNQVVGYSGTLALSAVVWNDTATVATGQLSVTNANMPANGRVTINNQTFNKGGGIRIRAFDSALNIVGYSSSMTVTQPPLTIDHYAFQIPANVSVGVPFRMEIDAQDAGNAGISYGLDRTINVQAFIAGTGLSVAGSGSLGNSNVTLVAGSTYAVVTAQTYNKIESIQLKATDQDSTIGSSSNLTVTGPTQFSVVLPTAAPAGQNFQVTVVARDAGNAQVTGYNGTVSLSAVQASNTSLSGGGVLGVTNLNLSGGQVTTAFQTYTKAEGIRLRISDSGIGITSFSSSVTVRPGPPASLSILANPQSSVATVPSVLTSTVLDLFNNAVAGSTVTFQLLNGSGTVSASFGGLPSAVTSTNTVANSAGTATAFFASTNTTSSQANVLRASIGSLLADTTVYNAVLVGPAGGTIVNFGDPQKRAIVPAGAYGVNVRLSLNAGAELSSTDIALATAAMAKSPNTFVSTSTAKIVAVLDSNPNVSAGNASAPVTVKFPFTADGGNNVSVGSLKTGSLGPASILVPFSVMRVFKLNNATSVFEMVLDGTNLPSIGDSAVSAQVTDPNGIYALGAPPYTTVSAASSATISAPLASGATVTVTVPLGAFTTAATVQVSLPTAASVPPVRGTAGLRGLGVTVSVSAGGLQPVQPVEIAVGYSLADLGSADPETLRLARYEDGVGWMVLDSRVNTLTRVVTGSTNHFSLFQIVAVTPQGDVARGFAFPNPFRPSQGHSTLGFANLPASARVRIFSISGRFLKDLETDATGRVTGWNAVDNNGRALPSGVYLAVFESGGGKRTFKFAIQR